MASQQEDKDGRLGRETLQVVLKIATFDGRTRPEADRGVVSRQPSDPEPRGVAAGQASWRTIRMVGPRI